MDEIIFSNNSSSDDDKFKISMEISTKTIWLNNVNWTIDWMIYKQNFLKSQMMSTLIRILEQKLGWSDRWNKNCIHSIGNEQKKKKITIEHHFGNSNFKSNESS